MKLYILKLFLLFGGPIFIVVKSASAQSSQPLPEFDKIRIDDNVQVELVIADRYSVYIENKSPNSEPITVYGGILSLNAENALGQKVKVFTKNVQSIVLDGAARLETLDTISSASLTIKLDGASMVKLNTTSPILNISQDGASELIISGTATTAIVTTDGIAAFKGKSLMVTDVTASSDGASKIIIGATNTLNAKADGKSKILFSGNPVNRNFSVDGFAKIESLDAAGETYNNIIEEEKVEGIDGDTTRVKIGKRRLMIIEDKNKEQVYGDKESKEERHRKMKSVWGGFELGVQGFSTPGLNFNIPAPYNYLSSNVGGSWFFGLNLPELDAQIIENKLAFTTGLGILWSNIRFSGNDYLTPNVDSMAATTPAVGTNFTLNKLYTFDITAPLLLKFAPGTKKKAVGGFHIAAGAIFHYVATTRVVTETSSQGYDQRVELNDDFNINSFRADATVRVGFDRIRLFANYSLTPYFNNSKAPDVRLFSAGLTLIGF
jgi:hypothetical protein